MNAFFVAAEFALVKVNKAKIRSMQADNNPFATVALWLYNRQSKALSACQMGITMASLALGWIGEPALAHLLKPLLQSIGITSESVLHGSAFAIAFTAITALHIVIGEQVPKIYAIRKPIPVVGWSSYPLKAFYILFYPFMWALDMVTAWLLKFTGIDSSGEHEAVLTEDEIRASLSIAYHKGDLTKHEHQLLDAAFKFDDQVVRLIMVPRVEISFFDLQKSFAENLSLAKNTLHTRFPLCDGSLDSIKGVIHIKDLIGLSQNEDINLDKLARQPIYVSENLPVHLLLQEFKKSKQHMAFVEDEYGTLMGMVTLENVLEQLIGDVQDEFDSEKPIITKESEGKYVVDGQITIDALNELLALDINSSQAETLSGLLAVLSGYRLETGNKIEIEGGIMAEILKIKARRAVEVRLTIPNKRIKEEAD